MENRNSYLSFAAMKEKENFTPCAMPCTLEQWENQLKPILELIEGVQLKHIHDFKEFPHLVNSYNGVINSFGNVKLRANIYFNRPVLETFNLCKFLRGSNP